ncbi:MAG: hypothetical protein ACE5HO_05285 [bacterium]
MPGRRNDRGTHVTIHAIKERDDDLFGVMEYIEGQELREMIANLAKVSNLRKVPSAAQPQTNGTRILQIERIYTDLILVKIKRFMSHSVQSPWLK